MLESWPDIQVAIEKEQIFKDTCGEGQLAVAKWLYEVHKFDVQGFKLGAFSYTLTRGQIDVAKWMWTLRTYTDKEIDNAFYYTFMYANQFDTAVWLTDMLLAEGKVIGVKTMRKAFATYCKRDCMDKARWLLETATKFGYDNKSILVKSIETFRKCCAEGLLDISQWLWQLNTANGNVAYDIHFDKEQLFRTSCRKGYIDIAKWLVELGDITGTAVNIHTRDDVAIKSSCREEHMDVLKWLVKLSIAIDDPFDADVYATVFKDSCKAECYTVARQLVRYHKRYGVLSDKLMKFVPRDV